MKLLSAHHDPLSAVDIEMVAHWTEGYSCSDLTNLAREAALSPLRSCPDIQTIREEDLRPIHVRDFRSALTKVRKSVDVDLLDRYQRWNGSYGDIS